MTFKTFFASAALFLAASAIGLGECELECMLPQTLAANGDCECECRADWYRPCDGAGVFNEWCACECPYEEAPEGSECTGFYQWHPYVGECGCVCEIKPWADCEYNYANWDTCECACPPWEPWQAKCEWGVTEWNQEACACVAIESED